MEDCPVDIDIVVGHLDAPFYYWNQTTIYSNAPNHPFYTHPEYNGGSNGSIDMALIRVEPDITFDDRLSVGTACLPASGVTNTVDEYALITGWGVVDNVGNTDDNRHMGWVKIIAPSTFNWTIDEPYIFAGTVPPINGTAICAGDSGGPLVQYVSGRAVLIGVASKSYTFSKRNDTTAWNCASQYNNSITKLALIYGCNASKDRCPIDIDIVVGALDAPSIQTTIYTNALNRPFVTHPTYKAGRLSNGSIDMVLIRVQPDITFDDRLSVGTACLPASGVTNTADEYALISGWGSVDNVGKFPVNRHMGWVKIMAPGTLNWTTDQIYLYAQHVSPINGTVVCQGDSGGPLVQYVSGRAVLIGVASRSIRSVKHNNTSVRYCASQDADSITIWMRVSAQIDWIIGVIRNDTYVSIHG
ncbi:unnamed protein product [Medioppia subpectinata]|uniref:Peptidase S1 domain-containing protein n=1 Tax=Medioppia subpectinata TaxID=1979941 RepID=A0A7R9PY51_9ACAR|nr:unnamed protein product [Medioppia subpectinata]CAG2105513.1 unnamed protein product [Medioppia subpectinata]